MDDARSVGQCAYVSATSSVGVFYVVASDAEDVAAGQRDRGEELNVSNVDCRAAGGGELRRRVPVVDE